MSIKHVILLTGGTGGHIFPAIATSESLTKHGIKVTIICDKRGAKWKKYFHCIDSFYIVPASHTLWKMPFFLLFGFVNSIKLFVKLRPQYTVSFGGYFSVAPLLASWLLKIPFVLHEGNSVLGRANYLFAKQAYFLALSFQKTKNIPKKVRVIYTGMPLRSLPTSKKSKKFILLVIGGSLSADIFSNVIPRAVYNLDLELWLQTKKPPKKISGYFTDFFDDLPDRIARASFIISRSGAVTLWEIITMNKPCLFIPIPSSVNNHQYENAKYIVQHNAGYMMEQKNFTPSSVRQFLIQIIQNPNMLYKTSETIKKFNQSIATKTLCDHLINEL